MIEQYLLIKTRNSCNPPEETINLLFREFVEGKNERGSRKYAPGVENVCMGYFDDNQARALFSGDKVILEEIEAMRKTQELPFIARIKVNDLFISEDFLRLEEKYPDFTFQRHELKVSESPAS